MIYDDHMINGDCGPDFLTFALQLRDNFGKNLNQEIDPTGIEPGSATWEVAMLSQDLSRGIIWTVDCTRDWEIPRQKYDSALFWSLDLHTQHTLKRLNFDNRLVETTAQLSERY